MLLFFVCLLSHDVRRVLVVVCFGLCVRCVLVHFVRCSLQRVHCWLFVGWCLLCVGVCFVLPTRCCSLFCYRCLIVGVCVLSRLCVLCVRCVLFVVWCC